jgi:hypothetical protein
MRISTVSPDLHSALATDTGTQISDEIDSAIDVDHRRSNTNAVESGKREVNMSQLQTLMTYVGLGPRSEDYAFLGLPVYNDNLLPLLWEAAEIQHFPSLCVYKMNPSANVITTVISKRLQKSSKHLVNMRHSDHKYAIDFAESLKLCD